jgi:methenyltetrahydrofolate cyclohydrolase
VSSAPAPSPEALGRFTDRFRLATLIESLASPAENPASGSAAAAAAAFAAGLVAKVGRGAGNEGAVAQAELLAARLAGLAAEDADVYGAAVSALAQDGDPSESRDFLLGTTLRRAADVPLQIAEAAADVAVLSASLGASVPPDQHADAVGAAFLAHGAARAAAHLVEINLAAREGDERQRRARGAVSAASAAVSALVPGGAGG